MIKLLKKQFTNIFCIRLDLECIYNKAIWYVMLNKYNVAVGLICCADGGTTLKQRKSGRPDISDIKRTEIELL